MSKCLKTMTEVIIKVKYRDEVHDVAWPWDCYVKLVYILKNIKDTPELQAKPYALKPLENGTFALVKNEEDQTVDSIMSEIQKIVKEDKELTVKRFESEADQAFVEIKNEDKLMVVELIEGMQGVCYKRTKPGPDTGQTGQSAGPQPDPGAAGPESSPNNMGIHVHIPEEKEKGKDQPKVNLASSMEYSLRSEETLHLLKPYHVEKTNETEQDTETNPKGHLHTDPDDIEAHSTLLGVQHPHSDTNDKGPETKVTEQDAETNQLSFQHADPDDIEAHGTLSSDPHPHTDNTDKGPACNPDQLNEKAPIPVGSNCSGGTEDSFDIIDQSEISSDEGKPIVGSSLIEEDTHEKNTYDVEADRDNVKDAIKKEKESIALPSNVEDEKNDTHNEYEIVKALGKYMLKSKDGKITTLPEYFKTGEGVAIDKNFIEDDQGNIYEIKEEKKKIILKRVKEASTAKSDDEEDTTDKQKTTQKKDYGENPSLDGDLNEKEEKPEGENNPSVGLHHSQTDNNYDNHKTDTAAADHASDDRKIDDQEDDGPFSNTNNLDSDDNEDNGQTSSPGGAAGSTPVSTETKRKPKSKLAQEMMKDPDQQSPTPPPRRRKPSKGGVKTNTEEIKVSYSELLGADTSEDTEHITIHVIEMATDVPSSVTLKCSWETYLKLQYVLRNSKLFTTNVKTLGSDLEPKLRADDSLDITIKKDGMNVNECIKTVMEHLLGGTDHLMTNSLPITGSDKDIFRKMVMDSSMGDCNEIFACSSNSSEHMYLVYPEQDKERAEKLFSKCAKDSSSTHHGTIKCPHALADTIEEELKKKHPDLKVSREELKTEDDSQFTISGANKEVENALGAAESYINSHAVNLIAFKDIKYYTHFTPEILEEGLEDLKEARAPEEKEWQFYINEESGKVSMYAKHQGTVDTVTTRVKKLFLKQDIEVHPDMQMQDIHEKLLQKVTVLMKTKHNVVMKTYKKGIITLIGLQKGIDCVQQYVDDWFRELRDIKNAKEQKVTTKPSQISWQLPLGHSVVLTDEDIERVDTDVVVEMSEKVTPDKDSKAIVQKGPRIQKRVTLCIPAWNNGKDKEKEKLRTNVKLLMDKSSSNDCVCVAFCVTGKTFGWKTLSALFKMILHGVNEFFSDEKSSTMSVIFVCQTTDVLTACYDVCKAAQLGTWSMGEDSAIQDDSSSLLATNKTTLITKMNNEPTEQSIVDRGDVPQNASWSPKRLEGPTLEMYVSIKNWPSNTTEEEVKSEIRKHKIDGWQLSFSKRLNEAIVICKSKKDAKQLLSASWFPGSKCSTPTQVVTNYSCTLQKKDADIIRQIQPINHDEIGISLHDRDTMTVLTAPTLCQLYSAIERIADCLAQNEPVCVVDSWDVSENVYIILRQIKNTEIDHPTSRLFENIMYKDGKVFFDRPSDKSIYKELKEFIIRLNSQSIEIVDIEEKFHDKAYGWSREFTNNNESTWCAYDTEKKKMLICYKEYETLKTIKHQINVKQGKVKITKRHARQLPSENEPTQADLSRKQATFKWATDAKNVKIYRISRDIIVHVYEASITNLPVQCIVNAANEHLQHGGGVALAIANAAGPALTQESKEYIRYNGKVPVGLCCSTTAGSLPYQRVIHAVGPCWYDYQPHSAQKIKECEDDLYSAVMHSFFEAEKYHLDSIALPAISSALFGVPEDVCTYQYVKATMDYCAQIEKRHHLKEIHFVDIKPQIIQSIQKRFGEHANGNLGLDISKSVDSHGPKQPRLRTNRKLRPDIYLFEYDEGQKHVFQAEKVVLNIYKCDIFHTHVKAVVCVIDEKGNSNSKIAQALVGKLSSTYRQELRPKYGKSFSIGDVRYISDKSCIFSQILHVVLPKNMPDLPEHRRKTILRDGYKNILQYCQGRKDIRSIAMSHLGTDSQLSTEVFFEVFLEFCQTPLKIGEETLSIHFVCKESDKFDLVYNMFHNYTRSQNQPSCQKVNNNGIDKTPLDSTVIPEKEKIHEDVEVCVICMDSITAPRSLKCGHTFCTDCIEQALSFKQACPTCFQVIGVITGDQPDGTMTSFYSKYTHCTGYENYGTITINYDMFHGYQEAYHPHPGKRYKGFRRSAYLPGNRQGNLVLEMLKIAFDRKLVFTIGSSRTTGEEGVITWNDIHHKTNPNPHGKFGYPDNTYLNRVTEELSAKGVTEKDIPEDISRKINWRFQSGN